MWMTDGYVKFESTFDVKMGVQDEIDLDVISRQDTKIIRPRVDKSKEEQKERIKKRAEVFTPSWVCKEMIDLPDREIRKSTDWRGYIREPASLCAVVRGILERLGIGAQGYSPDRLRLGKPSLGVLEDSDIRLTGVPGFIFLSAEKFWK